jgi:N-acetylneuraminate synthase
MDSVFIIAEAGVNHNGNLKTAFELVDAAKDSGVNAVKFQTFISEKLVSKSAGLAEYQAESGNPDETQMDLLKKLELPHEDFKKIKEYCDKTGIMFLTTPDEFQSADYIFDLVEIYKIGSGELTNLPYLKHIAGKNKPVILSTGMSFMEEIKAAVKAITENQNCQSSIFPPLTLLHCVSNYPAKLEDVNLNAISAMKTEFGIPVGYSDHTMGMESALGAVALGATVIEKHFTLDRNMEGPDHKASLDPTELKIMAHSIRNLEKALGDGIKRPAENELPIRDIVRKSLVAASPIKSGEKLTENMLEFKRPGSGISPTDLNKALGKILKRDIMQDELLKWDDLSD